jgi:hypothetical protein
MKNVLFVVALAACFTIVGLTASAQPASDALIACSKIQDAAARVRCYDAQIAAMKPAASAPAAAPAAAAAPAPAVAVAPPSPPAAAGSPAARPQSAGSTTAPAAVTTPAPAVPASSPAHPQSAGSAAAPAAPSPAAPAVASQFGSEQLPPSMRPRQSEQERVERSSITALRALADRTYVISLANGQVWAQDGAHAMIFFRVGDDVRVEKGLLGSYRMSTAEGGEKNWVRVTRLQ